MGAIREWAEAGPELSGEILDRPHLEHYTMYNQPLMVEVLGLFLAQLPVTLELLDGAQTTAEWRFAAHSLKGAAASVGAPKLRSMALGLETFEFPGDPAVRLLRIQALRAAAAEFREAVRRSYPAVAET